MIIDNQSHSEQALARLPGQFSDSTELRKLVSAHADRFQGINDQLILILNGRSVNDASGIQLDNIATVFNLTRNTGESDTDFRARIIGSTSALSRSGEPEHIIETYITLTGATKAFYAEIYPAGIQVTAHSDTVFTTEEEVAITNAMKSIKGGGISLTLVISPESEYMTFSSASEVDGSGNGPIDLSEGLGSTLNSNGGQLSRVLISSLSILNILSLAGESFMQAGEPMAQAANFFDLI